MYDKYHDKTGLEIFAIYTPVEEKSIPDTEMSAVKKLAVANNIKYPILIDTGFKFFREYGVIALPSTILINKAGKIQFVYPSFPLAALPVITEQIRTLSGVARDVQKKEKIVTKGPDPHSYRLYRYAFQMYKNGMVEQAFSSLQKSLDHDPDNSSSHNLMGVIFWKRGNSQDAMDQFKRAIELDKNNNAAHLNYTVLLFEQGQYKEAEKIITSASYLRVDFTIRAHYLLGLVHRNTNKIDAAIKELELAVSFFEVWATEKEDSHFSAVSFRTLILRDLSELYRRKGNDKKAIESLFRAVQTALGFENRMDKESLNQREGIMVYE
jgi:tetratricopeptide (TPR) repeat protein